MRIKALVKTEMIEILRNPTINGMPLIVIGLTVIYALMAGQAPSGFFVAASLMMAAYVVGFQVPTLSIAESKERRTLEAVMLTPVTPMEVIGSKVVVATLFSAATGAICMAIYRTAPANWLLLLLGFLLALLIAISLGLLIGLLAKDQKSAGVLSAPVMMVLLLFTIMPWPEISMTVWDAMRWLPTRPLLEVMMTAMGDYESSTPTWQSILIMLPYVALCLLAAARQVRRQASAR